MRARRFRPRTGPGNSKEHYRDFSDCVSTDPPIRPNYPDSAYDPSLLAHERPTGEKG